MIVERCGDRLLHPHDIIVTELVELSGAYPWPNIGANEVQHLSGELTGDPHLIDFFWRLDGNARAFSGVHGRYRQL